MARLLKSKTRFARQNDLRAKQYRCFSAGKTVCAAVIAVLMNLNGERHKRKDKNNQRQKGNRFAFPVERVIENRRRMRKTQQNTEQNRKNESAGAAVQLPAENG